MLENETQGWFSTIPEVHQVTTSDVASPESPPRHDSRLFQHMQTLLYLRGNYIRCLIHRHHVVSPANIARSLINARLVVSIAQDTIRILVNLNDTSDIYSRHQVAFNYFLISAVSIMLLAVCHAPAEFAQECRKDFFAAINLIRGFSRLSLQGRRLWSSLRGLVTRLRQLGIMNDGVPQGRTRNAEKAQAAAVGEAIQGAGHASERSVRASTASDQATINLQTPTRHEWLATGTTNFQTTTPDMNLMGDDLIGVFDIFGRAYMGNNINPQTESTNAQFDDGLSFLNTDTDDFSEYFMDLI